jgi:hypothetical protein
MQWKIQNLNFHPVHLQLVSFSASWSPRPHTPLVKFEGPWFTTQILLASSIGFVSFLLFSYCRPRWPLLFAPRTKLKGTRTTLVPFPSSPSLAGFSPHEAHAHSAFFGWIMPTLKTSEYTILQIVGLDAAVVSLSLAHNHCHLGYHPQLLGFFKMSFYLFSLCSLFAVAVLMPINWTVCGTSLGLVSSSLLLAQQRNWWWFRRRRQRLAPMDAWCRQKSSQP